MIFLCLQQQTYSTLEIIGKISAIVIPLLAICVALWKDDIMEWLKAPKLKVEDDPLNPAANKSAAYVEGGPWHFLRVIVENTGGAAIGVRARLKTRIWPNAIHLRWSGAVGEDQVSTHIPRGEKATLDILGLVAYNRQLPIGQTRPATVLPSDPNNPPDIVATLTEDKAKEKKWQRAYIVTQDRVRKLHKGEPFELENLEQTDESGGPRAFELLLYTKKKILGRCYINYVHGEGKETPSITVGPMRK